MSLPPHRNPRVTGSRLVGMLGSQVLVGAAIAAAFVGLYVGLQLDPHPHDLPIAVVGAELSDGAAQAWGAKAQVVQTVDADAARQLLEEHRVVGAIVPAVGSQGLDLLTAGANGRSAVGAVSALAAGLAEAINLPLRSTTDLVPLATYDAQGLSGFYLVFGVTLAAFVLAQIMYSIAGLVRLRWRVVTLGAGAVATAAVAAVLAGPVYGAIPATVSAVIPVLALLGAGISLSTLAIATVVGPLGNVVSTIMFTTLGNASSGATISPFLMPAAIAATGAALPPGAAFRIINEVSYFDGRDAIGSLLVLIAWVAAACGVLVIYTVRSRARSAVTPVVFGAGLRGSQASS
jgi:hypothetical protein